MTLTQFEAAAVCDYHNHREDKGTITELVLDMDMLQAGLCQVAEDGEAVLLERTEPAGDMEEQRASVFHGQPMDALFRSRWKEQVSSVNQRLERYFRSSEQLDSVACEIQELGIQWKCSQLRDWFAGTKGRLEEVFRAVDGFLDKRGIDEDGIRILLIGEWSDYGMFSYAAKEYFSFDLFMEDVRFADFQIPKSGADIIAEAEAIIIRKTTAGHEIEFSYLEPDGEGLTERRQALLKKGQLLKGLREISWFGPVFTDGEEPLRLVVDGLETDAALPFSVPADKGELVEIGAGLVDGRAGLKLRRMGDMDNVYDIWSGTA